MHNLFLVKVTEHYGYRKHKSPINGEVFVVCSLGRPQESVSGFEKESRAKKECIYLEKLNYGGKEDVK